MAVAEWFYNGLRPRVTVELMDASEQKHGTSLQHEPPTRAFIGTLNISVPLSRRWIYHRNVGRFLGVLCVLVIAVTYHTEMHNKDIVVCFAVY